MTRQPNDLRILSALSIGFPLTARQLATCLTLDLSWTRRLIGRLHEGGKIRITGTVQAQRMGKPENIYSLTRKSSTRIEG